MSVSLGILAHYVETKLTNVWNSPLVRMVQHVRTGSTITCVTVILDMEAETVRLISTTVQETPARMEPPALMRLVRTCACAVMAGVA